LSAKAVVAIGHPLDVVAYSAVIEHDTGVTEMIVAPIPSEV